MRVAVVNAGSSSLKLRLLDEADALVRSVDVDRWGGEDETDDLRGFLGAQDEIDVIAHRVVHGGLRFDGPARLDDAVTAELDALCELAPIHQPRALAAIRAVRSIAPDTPAVACFDTAFHTTLPPAASTYALPREWRERWPVKRFGFHGLSHAYAARRGAQVAGLDPQTCRAVTCHLGAGASLCAVEGGRSVDTTMGFTPLEGLVMATRSGTVDPGLVLWLIDHEGLSPAAVQDALEHQSGLAGLARVGDGDMRTVLKSADDGDADARLALDVYVHRLAAAVAAMAAALGGLDLLVFTGGVGEHAPQVRTQTASKLGFLGVAVSDDGQTADADLSAPGASARTVVVTAREDVEMARQARALLSR